MIWTEDKRFPCQPCYDLNGNEGTEIVYGSVFLHGQATWVSMPLWGADISMHFDEEEAKQALIAHAVQWRMR